MTGDLETLAHLGEEALLARILPLLGRAGDGVDVGPGDDAAVLRTGPSVVATTDAMVLGSDWLDRWSAPEDVGAKAVAQNLADVAAMGARGTGLLVTLLAPPSLPVLWAEGFARGLGGAAQAAGVPVLGGDLGSVAPGTVVISVTALGDLEGRAPVLRSGAAPGHVLAVGGSLGRSGAGLELLMAGTPALAPALVDYHVAPAPPLHLGPAAARAGASAMLDVSDGLGRDAGRLARASGVRVELEPEGLAGFVAGLAPLEEDEAWSCVLSGGEEHSMLATFPGDLPAGFTRIGRCVEPRDGGPGVWLGEERLDRGGWDHFRG